MFTIKVKYTDFNDTEREETLYFNLSKTELLDLEVAYPGGLEAYGSHMSDNLDRKEFVDFVHDLLKRTYGVKDPSGKRFIKSPEVFDEFKQSSAYDEIFFKLLTDDKFAYDFLTAAIPRDKDMKIPSREEILAQMEQEKKANTTLTVVDGTIKNEN